MKPQSHSQDADVRLVPVIEMIPTDYAITDRPLPLNAPDEYFRYWSACLSDSGIEGLQPIQLRHVPIKQLTGTRVMERIIQAHRFSDTDNPEDSLDRFDDPEEYLAAFRGGYALTMNDRVICTPRCCAGLSDICNWQEAADYRGAEWTKIWIGHPWISVRFDGAHLVFLDHDEEQGRTEWDGELTIAPEALQNAINHAKQDIQEFYQRLLPIVESIAPLGQAVQITEKLTACDRTLFVSSEARKKKIT